MGGGYSNLVCPVMTYKQLKMYPILSTPKTPTMNSWLVIKPYFTRQITLLVKPFKDLKYLIIQTPNVHAANVLIDRQLYTTRGLLAKIDPQETMIIIICDVTS